MKIIASYSYTKQRIACIAKIETFCCEAMECNWGGPIQLPSWSEDNVVQLCSVNVDYEDVSTDYVDIFFCPFCGERLDVKSEGLEQAKKDDKKDREDTVKQRNMEERAAYERLKKKYAHD